VTESLLQTFTIHPAKYAKGKMAVHCKADGSGWRTLAALIISEMKNVRYSNRERAFIVSPRCAEKFVTEMARAESRRSAVKLIEEAHAAGMTVDYINGIATDNRLENLRIVTLARNL
jgi:hypothetical protein